MQDRVPRADVSLHRLPSTWYIFWINTDIKHSSRDTQAWQCMCVFGSWVLEKEHLFWRRTTRRWNQSILKAINSEYSLERMMLMLQYIGHLMQRACSFEKTLMLGEKMKAGAEGSDRGWDDWTASRTHWTWIWANSGRYWRTGKPGVLQSMGSQRVRHDLATKQQQNPHSNPVRQEPLSHPFHRWGIGSGGSLLVNQPRARIQTHPSGPLFLATMLCGCPQGQVMGNTCQGWWKWNNRLKTGETSRAGSCLLPPPSHIPSPWSPVYVWAMLVMLSVPSF